MRRLHPRNASWIVPLTIAMCALSKDAFARDPAAAREQLKAGYMLAQENRCDAAIPRFVESLRLDPKAITLINLADCEEKTGMLADALGHWIEARERAQAEGNAAIVEEAERRAKNIEPKLARLSITLSDKVPANAEVVRDGVVLGPVSIGVSLPVNPGKHTIVVRAKGHEDRTTEIDVTDGERKDIVVEAGPSKPAVAAVSEETPERTTTSRGGTSPLVYAGFGTAIVGVGVGAVTGILALGKANDVADACPGGNCRSTSDLDAVDSGRTLGTVSTVAFIVGGVGAVVGIYGLVAGGKSGDSGSVAVSIGPNGGGLRGSF